MLETATRGTAHTPSLGPYRKKKDGHGAYFALVQQFAGKDKCQRQVDDATDFLVNTRWKGQSSYPLASFVATMREKWMDLEAASKHVPVHIPSEYMRVGYLLDHIQCSDSTLQATMASCRNDTQDTGGEKHYFEKCYSDAT